MMPKDAYYFKHDSNASSDLKLKAVRKHYGWQGLGWFWFLIELMRNEEIYGLGYDQLTFDGLADDLGCPPDTVKEYIDYCVNVNLFEKNETHFYSYRLSRDMETLDAMREQRREAGIRSAEKRLGVNTKRTSVKQPLNARSTIRTEQNTTDKNRTIIPDWIDKEMWDSFLEMRKGKRSIPTKKAIELLVKELEKLKLLGNNPNEVLQRSIMNSWKGVFPLDKTTKPAGGGRQMPTDEQRRREFNQ